MAVMSAIVYYVLPGLLGRAYDLKTSTVGPDLFDANTTHARVIEKYLNTAEYRLVSDASEAKDFLDIHGKLDLKLKSGSIHGDLTGGYLKQTGSFKNKVEMLIKVHFETVTETLPSDSNPLPDWKKIIEEARDTHYIRSITYGGDLIASLSFITKNEDEKEKIKAHLQGDISAKSGSLAIGVNGTFEKIMNATNYAASTIINYYATVPLDFIPRTLEDLMELIERFPNQTMKVNNGKGNPVNMEVFSLEGLSKDMKTYYQTQAFKHMMDVLSEQFSDLTEARVRLHDWMTILPPVLSDEAKHKISEFTSMLHEVTMVFSEVIGNLDLSNDASPSQFHRAYDAYKGNEDEIYPDMYVIKLSKLKADIMSNALGEFEADFGGAIYTYWGKDECPSGSYLVYNGKAASSAKNTIPSTKLLCVSENPDDISIGDNHDNEEIEDLPKILPVVFRTRWNEEIDAEDSKVKCAICRLPGKSSVAMLPGKKECPSGWTEQYQGVLVSSLFTHTTSELVCLDFSWDSIKGVHTENPFSVALSEVSVSGEEFPVSVANDEGFPCVVCSTSKQTKVNDDVTEA